MFVGINYPWVHYGWDFGDPPPAWVAGSILGEWREKKRTQIEEDFQRFASQGIFAARWFIMADGLNYGIDDFAPRKTGESWSFDPLPSSHTFYEQLRDDFAAVLQICRNTGVRLFPSLIDFHWCRQGFAIDGSPGIIKCGRYDILRDRSKRQTFLERVLDPLLEISALYRDSIYGWELINEPEWVVRRFSPFPRKDRNRTVRRNEMKEFIMEGISRINRHSFPSSVGFAHWRSLDKWNSRELGITVDQFHYYAQDNRDLPLHAELKRHPCVVGEVATAASRGWPGLASLAKDQTVTNRLRCLEEKGYPACFLWSARAADQATNWTSREHQEIIAYTGSDRPGDLQA